jgi:hypothetical protein
MYGVCREVDGHRIVGVLAGERRDQVATVGGHRERH